MNNISLTELTEEQILQMQWDILEELKQNRGLTSPPQNKILTQKQECEKGGYKKGGIIEKLDNTFKEKETKHAPKKHTRRYHPPVILPNGIKLIYSGCVLYEGVYYDDDGKIILARGQPFPLKLNQLKHLMDNFDKIPKKSPDERKIWFLKNYGKSLNQKTIDRIIWNLHRGTFNELFKYYYNKNYRILFDDDGNLKRN